MPRTVFFAPFLDGKAMVTLTRAEAEELWAAQAHALEAMHDLLVWTLCQGFTAPETALIRHGYNAAIDDASAMVLEAKYGGDRLEP